VTIDQLPLPDLAVPQTLAQGRGALTFTDDGRHLDPRTPEEWDAWVSAGKTRNFCEDDPLLDWLARYGAAHGFVRDDETEGYDARTDLRPFVIQQGHLFEEGVVRLLRERLPTVRVGHGWEDARALAKAEETFDLMRAGAPLIEQAVLRNPQNRTYGLVDLLVRSDRLNELVPETLSAEEAAINAPSLGHGPWHYRAVDVKFHTMDLLKDGHADKGVLAFMAQIWVYNEALGRIQGYRPGAGFLLGRCWKTSKERGDGCFDRLARVDQDRVLNSEGRTLQDVVEDALGWIRRVRGEGAGWRVLPEPSVPELYPHARNQQDQPWHGAKSFIASELAELTLLPAMSPVRRRDAHAKGLMRWTDPRVSADSLGISNVGLAQKCDAVLEANRSRSEQVVFPDRIRHADPSWREPSPLELYVDFETVSNLNDDFSTLPTIGGQPLIFQIGCGRLEDGAWRFEQWTVDRLRESNERVVIGQFVDHVERLRLERGLERDQVRLVHWSPAEWVTYSEAYNAAKKRHPDNDWPPLNWFDALQQIVREEPITVRGAFNFSLKSIIKAMHAAGLLKTSWADGPTDGLGAMVGAWWCDGEAARLGVPMRDVPLMAEIGRYNEVDCRSMAELLEWLRANR
jgi:predicted RecB family nuclease